MICIACQCTIPQERLDAIPDTQYCVRCTDTYAPPTFACMDYGHKTSSDLVFAVGKENVRRLNRQNKRSR